MRKATLQQIGRKALGDKAFFDALTRDPENALKEAKLTVLPATLQDLKTILKKNRATVDVHVDILFEMVYKKCVDPTIAGGGTWKEPGPGPEPGTGPGPGTGPIHQRLGSKGRGIVKRTGRPKR